MRQTTMTRAELEDLVIRFTEAFNHDDLDGVMAFMADDAVYDEFNGTINYGKDAIRQAFVPQFRGDYGTMRFLTDDLFVDVDHGKALIRWRCALTKGERCREWRGLDILHFENGLLKTKLTYAKTARPLLTDTQEKP